MDYRVLIKTAGFINHMSFLDYVFTGLEVGKKYAYGLVFRKLVCSKNM